MSGLFQALRKRQKAFYWQIASRYIALSISITLIYFFGLVFVAWNFLDVAEQNLDWDVAGVIAAELQAVLAEQPLDEAKLKQQFFKYSELRPGTEYFLLDQSGLPIVATHTYLRAVDLEPIKRFLRSKQQRLRPIYGDNPRRDQPDSSIFSVAPVRIGSGADEPRFGYLYVILRGQQWYAVYGMFGNFSAITLGVLAALLCLLLGAILGLRVLSKATRRFERMTKVIQAFSQGEFQSRIRDTAGDELAEHAQAFDTMADTITTNMAELERVEQIRQELMSHVSHDLRTPVSVMRTTLESQILDYESLDDAARKQLLSQALSNCLSLNQLIAELSEINRLSQGAQALRLEQFSLPELVGDICIELTPLAKASGLTLVEEIEPAVGFVEADIGLLERVIRNILENAIRYSRPSTTITVSCKNQSGAVEVSIADQGVGIPEHELPLIFERFFRATNAIKHSHEGSGLGLSIVKRILDAHQVKLLVQSVEGEGTTFRFAMPINQPS